MKIRLALFVIPLFYSFSVSAQYYQKENMVWAFGDNAGIDFNTSPPKPIYTAMKSEGGSAAICNASGQLLFYCNSDTVWNRNNKPMPNAYNISSAHWPNNVCQNAAIAPVVGNPDQYYVFTLSHKDPNDYSGTCNLYYSIVDMTADHGLGDVIVKKIPIDSDLAPKMAVVKGTDCTIWLLVLDASNFKAYAITPAGVSATPVISPMGAGALGISNNNGVMKVSPDRTKVLLCNSQIRLNGNGLELYDFDTTSGLVSNVFVIDANLNYFGGCFSPNSSKIYVQGDSLFQYDISLSTHTDIIRSKTKLHYQSNGHDIKIGPDAKVYFANQDYTTTTFTLDRIEYPDLPGLACSYTYFTTLLPYTHFRVGFPNDNVISPTKTENFVHDTSICAGQMQITLSGPAGAAEYTWNDGSKANIITTDAPGIYWVTSLYDCKYARIDTFKVARQFLQFNIGPDTTMCAAPPYLLESPIDNATYLWSDGSTHKTYEAPDSGTYWLQVDLQGCQYADTVHIARRNCNCKVSVPSAFSPNNDGKNDRLRPVVEPGCSYDQYVMNIFNRWGQWIFTTKDINDGWDGNFKNVPCEIGAYMYELQIRANDKTMLLKGDFMLVR